MKKKFKKIIAAITVCAFTVGVTCPAYASSFSKSAIDIEEIKVVYDADGNLQEELCRINDTYYYKVLENDTVIVVAINQGTGKVDIVKNASSDDSYLEIATADLKDNNLQLAAKITKENAMQQVKSVVALVENNKIQFEQKALSGNLETVNTIRSVPADHKEAISQHAMTEHNVPAECTNQIVTSKSTTNVRASLYYTVAHEVDNPEMNVLRAGLKIAEIGTLIGQALISVVTGLLNALGLLAESAGEWILREDADFIEYDFRARETKTVKCDGHIDYTAEKVQYGMANVVEAPNGVSAIVTNLNESVHSLFNNNSALLDEGIRVHQQH